MPNPDVLIVPVGAGSGACGCGIVAAARCSETRVVGVQAEAAPAMRESWQAGTLEAGLAETVAEGLAT
ncbi:MAG: pyridoxal-phosphate dependent enzyme [Deltaproteobacteria bacterium]|nr:pyridoxal-phosphate dependent enzyme [Deltaproteobacteria bacterium]